MKPTKTPCTTATTTYIAAVSCPGMLLASDWRALGDELAAEARQAVDLATAAALAECSLYCNRRAGDLA